MRWESKTCTNMLCERCNRIMFLIQDIFFLHFFFPFLLYGEEKKETKTKFYTYTSCGTKQGFKSQSHSYLGLHYDL